LSDSSAQAALPDLLLCKYCTMFGKRNTLALTQTNGGFF
jgi:hypothetical protein